MMHIKEGHGLAFYRSIDLPECGQTLVFIKIKRVGKQLYQVYWMRELAEGTPLTAKDEMAMQVKVIEAARLRLRSRGAPEGDIYIV